MDKINFHITNFKTRTRDWFVEHAEGPRAKIWLSFFSFAEATFFPLPPDLLLIAILIARAQRWVYYALLTTITSVLGGIAGYFIGLFLFDTIGASIIELYNLEVQFEQIGKLFANNAFLTIFVSAFSPIPYKVFTLSAGFFNISFLIFVAASLVGRTLRFFAVAFLTKKFGKQLGNFIFTYFNAVSLTLAFLIILFVALF